MAGFLVSGDPICQASATIKASDATVSSYNSSTGTWVVAKTFIVPFAGTIRCIADVASVGSSGTGSQSIWVDGVQIQSGTGVNAMSTATWTTQTFDKIKVKKGSYVEFRISTSTTLSTVEIQNAKVCYDLVGTNGFWT